MTGSTQPGRHTVDEQQPVYPDGLTATEIADLLWLASLTGPGPGTAANGSDVGAALPDMPERPPPAPSPTGERLPDGVPDAPPPPRQDVQARATSAVLPPASHPSGTTADGAGGGTRRTLADPRALERALRPLRGRGSARTTMLLDEEATAEHAVEGGLWLPVLRPAYDRAWTEVVLIVDDSPSMVLWQETVREFTDLLSRVGVFRSVRTVRLSTGPEGDGPVPGGTPAVPRLRSRARDLPLEALSSPARSRLILVLTDGLGPAWLAGTVTPLLHHLGRSQVLAVLHVMPSRLWHLTGVTTTPARLRADAAPASNAALYWSEDGGRPPDRPDAGRSGQPPVPVPVLEVNGRWLHRWARLTAGRSVTATQSLPVLAATHEVPAVPLGPAPFPVTGTDIVRRARTVLSPAAFQLAVRLAAVPLTLPIVRQIQHEMVPDSGPEHLGEILAGGLLRYVPEPVERTADAGPTRLSFDFKPGVREELLAHGTYRDTAQVVRKVSRSLPAEQWSDGQRFLIEALDGREPPVPEITDGNRDSILLAATVLRALSGPHRATARRTEAALRTRPDFMNRDEESHHTTAAPDRPALGSDVHTLDAPEPSATASPRSESRLASTIWGEVPPRNVHFTGRQHLLETLHGLLAPDRPTETVHVLTGLGGVGKTQLAVEYVYRYHTDYDLVWWIRAAQPATMVSGFHDLAQALGLLATPDGPRHDAVPAVREALRAGDIRKRWLLVFDNAESVEEVRPFFPLGGPGAVLVTARSSQWAHVARTLEVDVFSREESMALVRRRNPRLGEDEADALAEALGDLPLALEQASVWLLDTGMPVSEYLGLFNQQLLALLDEAPPYDYAHGVSAAWNLSLDRLRNENPTAVELLHTLAWLAPEPVPTSVFHHYDGACPTAGNPLAVSRAIRAINRHALARIDHRTATIQLHRLLSHVLRDSMPDSDRDSSRRRARSLAASLPPSHSRTAHLLACRAAESRHPAVRSALLEQLRWLAAQGLTGEECRLAKTVREGWSRTGAVTAAELAELTRHLP
ncbi:FxSxx-COOH system tetratricopeptide repeat protein [Streptomyces sp. NPDC085927]|uniref:FxSxx-COOH system tetratricopeptide repeat protein n=1 Tax=Streptomyces sp. NPDC085927 TaxID=3365738 RepID=UPI0037D8BD06